jgi:hypothetical protein
MSLGELFGTYTDQMTAIELDAAAAAQSTVGPLQRQWADPFGWNGLPRDIPGLGDSFARDDMNAAYPTYFTEDAGVVGDCSAAKLQADVLGTQERAFRMRYASAQRCAIHAAARRNGHGMLGGVFGRQVSFVQDVLVAAAAAGG